MIAILDPLNKFPDILPTRLVESLGILPMWIDSDDERTARQQFEAKYEFGVHEMRGGTIDENGVYQYPEDPPLYPLATMQHLDDIIHFYQYAIVGIVNQTTGETFMTRLD